jgi:hypothetical protein
MFKSLKASLLEKDPSNSGAYLLINDKNSRSLHETHDSAWRGRQNGYTFVGRIEMDNSSQDILILSANE